MNHKQFLETVIKEAGTMLLDRFHKVGVSHTKRDELDVVTEADTAVNAYLVEQIRKTYPEHGIISEEMEEENPDAEYVWLIDPLDGTGNYATNVPIFCTIIGLTHNGEQILAGVYDPVHDELYLAEKDKGTTLNGESITVSEKKELNMSKGFMPCTFKSDIYDRILPSDARKTDRFVFNTFRCMGIQLAYVAAGRRDWVIDYGGCQWDYASTLLIKEAGGYVSDLSGGEWTMKSGEIVAANQQLHKELVSAIS